MPNMSIGNVQICVIQGIPLSRVSGQQQSHGYTCPVCDATVKHIHKHLKRRHHLDADERKDLIDRLRISKMVSCNNASFLLYVYICSVFIKYTVSAVPLVVPNLVSYSCYVTDLQIYTTPSFHLKLKSHMQLLNT